jgi:hypothetical protein
MTPPLRPIPSIRPPAKRLRLGLRCILVAVLLSPSISRALDNSAWAQHQEFTVAAPGLVKLPLPSATLDLARADLADLRVLDANGRETPYALVRPNGLHPKITQPRRFEAELTDVATTLRIETGTTEPLAAVSVVTPSIAFIKPVRTELSTDGSQWETVADSMPLFRQNGAEQLTIPLPKRPASWVRLTVDDRRSPPIAFTAATLLVGEARPALVEPVTVRITARDELPGETVLTLDLDAAHLSLTSLTFEADDSLFTRAVTITRRELKEDAVVERPLARGTIYRVALDGLAPAAHLSIPLNLTTTTRELIVHIDNGDSPPLTITEVRAERRSSAIVFNAQAPGAYSLLTGQPQAAPPRYDLPPLSEDFDRLPVTPLRLGPPVPNPDYQRPEALANVDLEGAALDPQGWTRRKPVLITSTGVQQLELDLDVLAHSQRDFSDLRLLRDGRQIPYLLERSSIIRPLSLATLTANDPKRPSLSRWKLTLPLAGLPLTRITVTSSSGLFQRRLRLYETITDERGYTRELTLAEGEWTHTPERPHALLSLSLATPPFTDTLWLETDNNANPPITLLDVQAWHPVLRLLFKAKTDDAPVLYYGHPQASAPRYDLGLVAGQLFSADKNPARLGASENLKSRARTPTAFISRRSGLLFWSALVLVVGLLLVVVVRLLPKPAKPETDKAHNRFNH